MRRLAAIILLLLAPDPHREAVEVLTGMAAALSESNLAAFMKSIDPAMPGYEQLRTRVAALLAQAEVVSSIEVVRDEGGDTRRALELDWLLQVRPYSDFAPLERRERTITCTIERRNNKWLVTALAPVDFFGP